MARPAPSCIEERGEVGDVLRHVDGARRVEAALAAPPPIGGDDAQIAGRGESAGERRQLAAGGERGVEEDDERREHVAEVAPPELARGGRGSAAKRTNDAGTFEGASRARHQARSASSPGSVAPARRTIAATGTAPQVGSARPATPASAIAGCAASTASTSAG